MTRTILNVSTGRFIPGQERLRSAIQPGTNFTYWQSMPPGSPSHEDTPYAFKAYAIQFAMEQSADLILWADASIVPIRDLGPLWDLIEKQGYWFSDNGWSNGQWCSDVALPLLGITRDEALKQKHLVGGAFGLNLKSEIGREFQAEHMRMAKSGAFRGPWANKSGEASADARVLGHRHDQTACSAIAHRLGMEATLPPEWFAYKGGETDRTVLIADGIC